MDSEKPAPRRIVLHGGPDDGEQFESANLPFAFRRAFKGDELYDVRIANYVGKDLRDDDGNWIYEFEGWEDGR